MTTSANSLVLVIISRFKRRTNSELIFANLAVTDVLGGLDFIFACIILLAGRRYFDFYVIDDVICQMVAISWYVVSISTPLMLALTCLGRFLAVFTPMRYGVSSARRYLIFKQSSSTKFNLIPWIIGAHNPNSKEWIGII